MKKVVIGLARLLRLATHELRSQMATKNLSTTLSLLCWNIDGLDEQDTIDRALYVCDVITNRRPQLVYLQEIVPSTWEVILKRLSGSYDCFRATKKPYPYFYYHVILVEKGSVKVTSSLQCLNFPNTEMDRHLLQLSIHYHGIDIQLLTSHLESMKDNGPERKTQLKMVFEILDKISKECPEKCCIFGGDLNVRDAEVRDVGVPDKVCDIWEVCGSPQAHKYTWDASKNDNLGISNKKVKFRPDRLYFSTPEEKLRAKTFELVGLDRLPGCGRFPSDHWGIWVEFEVQSDGSS